MEAKSAFPEDHPLALGTGGPAVTGHTLRISRADVVFGIGCSFTRHGMAASIPAGKTLIHATKRRARSQQELRGRPPLLGTRDSCSGSSSRPSRPREAAPPDGKRVRAELERVRAHGSRVDADARLGGGPDQPYRVIAEFMRTVNPRDAIVTHDSGSPRDQLLRLPGRLPAQLSWLGQVACTRHRARSLIGAKLAAPDKFCVNFMGDAAFGMTGLDFETAVRCGIPILTVVLTTRPWPSRSRTSSSRTPSTAPVTSADATRIWGAPWAAGASGSSGRGYRRRLRPRAQGHRERAAALLEFITSQETRFSNRARCARRTT